MYQAEELDGKAITEKEAKINWLVKLISLTELVVGDDLEVKPTKIIAGHEPEKTNALLQAMFRAATSGIDTSPHVAQILGLGGEGEGDEQEQEEGQEEDDGEAQAQAQAEAQAHAEAQAAFEAE